MTTEEVRDVARFLAAYAKGHGAGAFATPTSKELAARPELIREWTGDGHRVVAIVKRLTRDSDRTDYTGAKRRIPAGSIVVTHLAATPGAPLPDMSGYDFVNAYVEDHALSAGLAAQNRAVSFVRVSAAAELIACWGPKGTEANYSPADKATFTVIDSPAMPLDAMRAEVAAVDEWYDDFPFYSDGTWSAISLRGYKPSDPQWGVKPSEMPRKWRDEHPETINLKCDWTVITGKTPIIKSWVESIPWWSSLERVRLFRMDARPGKGGHLSRHSDIQDKSAGTRDGQLARFHVPLLTHPDITMTCWTLNGNPVKAHLAPGHIYYLDTRKPHAVDNMSPIDRVHLVVDAVVTPEVRQMIEQSREIAA